MQTDFFVFSCISNNFSSSSQAHSKVCRAETDGAINNMSTSRKRCEIVAKLALIINRKSHMSFRLVPNLVTLDDLERRNSSNRRVISPNLIDIGADYVNVVQDTQILSAGEM